jgi:hypothetical protein
VRASSIWQLGGFINTPLNSIKNAEAQGARVRGRGHRDAKVLFQSWDLSLQSQRPHRFGSKRQME